MGKKRSLFTCVKRLFTQSSKPKSQEKSKNWRWLAKKMKFKQHHCYPAIKEPQPKTLNEAAEEQRKRAVVVAVATAAAAEAAVAAANAAAEVVRLANKPKDVEMRILHLAAIEIQTAYRGHLARKALSAHKGIVKLQAVVRGELVRKSIIKKLASITFFSKAQPLLVHRNRVPHQLDYLGHDEKRRSFVLSDGIKYEELKIQSNSHKGLDLSTVSKEAITKRDIMRRYSFSHREGRNDQSLQEPMIVKRNTSTRFDQLALTDELKAMLRMNNISVDTNSLEKLKLKTTHKNKIVEDLNSPNSQSSRLFCQSIEDYGSLPNSPVFPAYMAATESTKAKSRSFSTPRQRMKLCETYSISHSPCKLSLSSGGSFNGELLQRNSNA